MPERTTPRQEPYAPPRNPEDFGDPWQRIYLPFSDLQWASSEKARADRVAIYDRRMPPGLSPDALSDPDWIAKDWEGRFLPGHIDTAERIYPEIASHFGVYRLDGVKQLAFLQMTTLREKNPLVQGEHFKHTRLFHSEVVARTTELILKRLGLPQEAINLGVIAGLLHDLATPAFGDPTKEIDPEALNEEDNLEAFIRERNIDTSVLERYGITLEDVLATVKNKGVVGKVLDIADKIAYTAVDVYEYTPEPFRESHPDDEMGLILEPIKALMRIDPKWANLFQEVALTEDNQLYFTNARRLGIFLEIRGRMHRSLYLNPHCRGLDMIYKLLVNPLYSRDPNSDKPLNPTLLRGINDRNLEDIIGAQIGIPADYYNPDARYFSSYMTTLPDFRTAGHQQNVEYVISDLESQGLLVLGSEQVRKFKTGTDFLALDPSDGKVKPYADINPDHSYYLENIAQDCNTTVVYHWPEREVESERERLMRGIVANSVKKYRDQHGGQYPHLTYP